jgi:pyrimidine operon attenuation protein/uracil phosphoribosyltransferase
VRPTEIPFTLKDRAVVLVDDVLYTGRTIRAALDALLDHGRPKRVLLAVLVDRGGRELPIQADIVGTTLKVAWGQRVSVKVKELDGEDGVFVEAKG